jgi:DNA-binding transcriptional MerR regulator
MARKKIDETTKQDVLKAHASGVSRKRIVEQYGISLSSVSRIIKGDGQEHSPEQGIQTQAKTERQKRIEDIERRIAILEKKILDLDAKKGIKSVC